MATRGAKVTPEQLEEAVTAFLNEAMPTIEEAKEAKSTAGIIPPTLSGFIYYCKKRKIKKCEKLTLVNLAQYREQEDDEVMQPFARQVQRIDAAAGYYYECLALIDPKLQQVSMLGMKQPNYGGYQDKPQNNVAVTIGNASSVKVDWSK